MWLFVILIDKVIYLSLTCSSGMAFNNEIIQIANERMYLHTCSRRTNIQTNWIEWNWTEPNRIEWNIVCFRRYHMSRQRKAVKRHIFKRIHTKRCIAHSSCFVFDLQPIAMTYKTSINYPKTKRSINTSKFKSQNLKKRFLHLVNVCDLLIPFIKFPISHRPIFSLIVF